VYTVEVALLLPKRLESVSQSDESDRAIPLESALRRQRKQSLTAALDLVGVEGEPALTTVVGIVNDPMTLRIQTPQ
jgi:hypothetical protein